MKKTYYGLRLISGKYKGKILGYRVSSNDAADFCGSTNTTLDEYEDNMWLVDTAENAEYVRQVSTKWYNAGHETPKHNFKPEQLEVCKVEIEIVTEPVKVKIPTALEYYTEKAKNDKGHEYTIKRIKDGENIMYSLWDLKDYMMRRK